MENLNFALASVIRRARITQGLTQGQLAGLAGLSEVYLSQLERGLRGDSLNAFMQIAAVLKMSGSQLLALVEKELSEDCEIPEKKRGRPAKTG